MTHEATPFQVLRQASDIIRAHACKDALAQLARKPAPAAPWHDLTAWDVMHFSNGKVPANAKVPNQKNPLQAWPNGLAKGMDIPSRNATPPAAAKCACGRNRKSDSSLCFPCQEGI
jgi:hypothetical protein